MKRSQIILLSVALVLSALIYIPVILNKKDYTKTVKTESKTVFVPIRDVENKKHLITLNSYGQVAPNTELMISFEVQGKLIEGSKRLKPGVSFRKGEVLYRIDGKELEYTIVARKMGLASIITQSLPDLILDFPQEKKKWEDFLMSLTRETRMPDFPKLNSRKEQQFWTTRNVPTEYFTIISQEARAEKYTYIAPFSGTVTEVYAEPGSIVNPGVQVAKVARTGEFELKVPVALDDLEEYKAQKTARFTDSEGNLLATGSIIRISDVVNQRTQSADIYYSVKPVENRSVYNGLYMNVTLDYEAEKLSMLLPRTAVKDGQVLILENDKLVYQDVIQIGKKPDSLYVTGLSNGQNVLLEQIGAPSDKVTYKPIER